MHVIIYKHRTVHFIQSVCSSSVRSNILMWKWLINNNYVSCTSKLTADIDLQWNNYSCVWLVVLTPKWHKMPKGIWNGHCFLTLITPVLQEHVKHEHISHFCRTTWTKSYIIAQESLGSLGLFCPRLHPRVTSQLPGLLHLPVKPRLSTSCSITNMIWAVTGSDPLYRLAYREKGFC